MLTPREELASHDAHVAPGPNYFIPDHIFVCRVRRHWILLDILRNKYLCIPHAVFAAIASRIHGWDQWHSANNNTDVLCEDVIRTLESSLCRDGILSITPRTGRPLAPILPQPSDTMPAHALQRERRRSFLAAIAFCVACSIADIRLRFSSFASIVRRATKRTCLPTSTADTATRAYRLTREFNALRLWYPRKYVCLFDSFALLEFLALHHVSATWVFGVAADPFEAHCWLELNGCVLNDRLERVRRFTPIMRV